MVMDNTLVSSGNPAIKATASPTLSTGITGSSAISPLACILPASIADISNYVLTHYGNAAIQVNAHDVAVLRAGGPITLLAKLQPYMAPAMVAGVVILLVLIFWLGRRRKTA